MNKALFIFDLDGVIYRGNTAVPYAAEAVDRLRSAGIKIHFLTNNASQTRESFVAKLSGMGIPSTVDEVMNSSYATALWFKEHGHLGKSVLIVGEPGCYELLRREGMDVLEPLEDRHADFVVVGIDRQFNYEKLKWAQQAILKGATFIATNRDPTYPLEGRVIPGGGSIVAAVATAGLQEPITIGKPSTYTLEKILEITGVPREAVAVVGDRLDTDILVGNRAGLETILVMTGVTTQAEADEAKGDMKPSRIVQDLRELP